jgi:hypothetical protein
MCSRIDGCAWKKKECRMISTSEHSDGGCSSGTKKRTCEPMDGCLWKNKACHVVDSKSDQPVVDCSSNTKKFKCSRIDGCIWEKKLCRADSESEEGVVEVESHCSQGNSENKCGRIEGCAWQDSQVCVDPDSTSISEPVSVITGTFRHIAEDVDFITPVRRYLIEDLNSGINVDLMFMGPVPADAAETPIDGTNATVTCTNQLPPLIKGGARYSKVKCVVPNRGFSLTKGARKRRQNYAEDGRPGYTVGIRTWIVTMLQIPGEHKITESERLAVSRSSILLLRA